VIVCLIAKRVCRPEDAGLPGGPAYRVPYDLWVIGYAKMEAEMVGRSGAYILSEKIFVKDTTEIPDPREHPRKKVRSWPS
jgi:hypothetical protein